MVRPFAFGLVLAGVRSGEARSLSCIRASTPAGGYADFDRDEEVTTSRA